MSLSTYLCGHHIGLYIIFASCFHAHMWHFLILNPFPPIPFPFSNLSSRTHRFRGIQRSIDLLLHELDRSLSESCSRSLERYESPISLATRIISLFLFFPLSSPRFLHLVMGFCAMTYVSIEEMKEKGGWGEDRK